MKHREDDLQMAVVQYLLLSCPENVLWYHCPNGEYRSKKTAAKLKRMGVRPGIPDLCFVLPGGRAAFIELKADKGVVSPEQKTVLAMVDDLGGLYAVCRSLDGVEDTLRVWGVEMKYPLHTRQPRPDSEMAVVG